MLEGPRRPFTSDTYSLPQHNAHTLRVLSLQHAANLFESQYYRSMLRRLLSRLLPLSQPLLDLSEILHHSPLLASHHLGEMPVPIACIQGSLGRSNDFDHRFWPIRRHVRQRWVNIAALRMAFTPLPPVELILVDGVYFVRDGHHRISVARTLGEVEVDAIVTEYRVAQPLQAALEQMKIAARSGCAPGSSPRQSLLSGG